MVKKVYSSDMLLAIIVLHNYDREGISFFTENHHSQQLAFMKHPSGRKIDAHYHNPVHREVVYTQEVLFIKKGRLRVDFYNTEQVYTESHILEGGDVILLVGGGHGFEVLEDIEMIEVKQGPYAGDNDKTRFEHVAEDNIKIVE